jgi:hypothetical protein
MVAIKNGYISMVTLEFIPAGANADSEHEG